MRRASYATYLHLMYNSGLLVVTGKQHDVLSFSDLREMSHDLFRAAQIDMENQLEGMEHGGGGWTSPPSHTNSAAIGVGSATAVVDIAGDDSGGNAAVTEANGAEANTATSSQRVFFIE